MGFTGVMSMAHRVSPNSIYPRCVDGRAAEGFIEWQSAHWIVAKRGAEARQENGPQFLGASLVFVRALEVIAGASREQAFYLAEVASERAGLGLQIHLDDAHGQYDFAAMDENALVSLIEAHHTGCGFAAYAWGDEADSVIQEAKRRHWRVQLVAGPRAEQGAVLNFVSGTTFDTAGAVAAGNGQFNIDVPAARDVFETLEDLTLSRGFADQAEAWMLATYRDVVIALKGVQSAGDIIEIK
jgi:hypothetical protein